MDEDGVYEIMGFGISFGVVEPLYLHMLLILYFFLQSASCDKTGAACAASLN